MPEYHFSLLCFFVLIHTSIKQDPNSPSAQPTGLPDFTFQMFLILWCLLQNAKKFITFKLYRATNKIMLKLNSDFGNVFGHRSQHMCSAKQIILQLNSYHTVPVITIIIEFSRRPGLEENG